jgi:hypothetical protein
MQNAVTQLHNLSPEQLGKLFDEVITSKFNDLKKHFQPTTPTEYLSRQEVAQMLKINLSTVHNMSVKGILQKYQISGRVLYKRSEVENAIVKLNN